MFDKVRPFVLRNRNQYWAQWRKIITIKSLVAIPRGAGEITTGARRGTEDEWLWKMMESGRS